MRTNREIPVTEDRLSDLMTVSFKSRSAIKQAQVNSILSMALKCIKEIDKDD